MSELRYGMYWYAASAIGFFGQLSGRANYYYVFDDIFVICTCFSLFYCWQMQTDDTMTLSQVWHDAIHFRQVIRDYFERKRKQREEEARYQRRREERRLKLTALENAEIKFENPIEVFVRDSTGGDRRSMTRFEGTSFV